MSMSVNASTTLNPALAAMLSQLTPSGGASSAPSFSPATTSAPATGVGTGSAKAQVSSDILNLFTQMHQAAGAHHGGGAGASGGTSGSTSTISSASTMMSPLDQLMSAIDMTDDMEDGASSTQTQYVDPNAVLDQSS